MNALAGYGSGSENSDDDTTTILAPKKLTTPSNKQTPSVKKPLSALLPPPSNKSSTQSSSGGLSLPLPKAKSGKKRDGPVRFVVEKLAKEDEGEDEDFRKAKKPRLDGDSSGQGSKKGAGSSSLLAMLPAPKVKVPLVPQATAPSRVLGSAAGGEPTGVIEDSPSIAPLNKSTDDSALSWLPTFLQKPRANAAPPAASTVSTSGTGAIPPVALKEDDGLDFFSLGPSRPKAAPNVPNKPTPATSLSISAAPKIQEYQPPDPTPYDPYPGYYQLPSGEWKAHDPAFYKKFWSEWQALIAQEQGQTAGIESKDIMDVNAMEESQKERLAELERQKNITAPQIAPPAQPNMKIKATGGRARTRHQLSSLLAEAYQNREAIEEKIAQGRRNQKEAGNKYGF